MRPSVRGGRPGYFLRRPLFFLALAAPARFFPARPLAFFAVFRRAVLRPAVFRAVFFFAVFFAAVFRPALFLAAFFLAGLRALGHVPP